MKQNPLAASRRKFLAAAPAVAAVPLLSACGGDDVTSAPVTDAALAAQMSAKLNAQLGDAATVGAIQPELTDVGFTWDLPSMPAAWAGAIVAYSFGNRPNAASGNTSSTGGNQSALPDPARQRSARGRRLPYSATETGQGLRAVGDCALSRVEIRDGHRRAVVDRLRDRERRHDRVPQYGRRGRRGRVARAAARPRWAASRWSVIGITRSAASRPRNRRA